MKNLPLLKICLFIFTLLLLFAGRFFILKNNSITTKNVSVISASISLAPSPFSNKSPAPTITAAPSQIILKKNSYSIAIFGDSMVDTMGENLEYLQKILSKKYPNTSFTLYNYGIGGQNVEQGLARFESSFVNRERNFPPIPALNPDILIIGSFAYNPFSTHDRNKHYSLLRELLWKAKKIFPNVYLLAETSPLKNGFGVGKNGVNMPEQAAREQAIHIIEQLDNVINLSNAENTPLINVYEYSKIDRSFGDPYYVNKDDGIHPSAAGHVFTAEIIVKKIKFD